MEHKGMILPFKQPPFQQVNSLLNLCMRDYLCEILSYFLSLFIIWLQWINVILHNNRHFLFRLFLKHPFGPWRLFYFDLLLQFLLLKFQFFNLIVYLNKSFQRFLRSSNKGLLWVLSIWTWNSFFFFFFWHWLLPFLKQ